MIGIIIPAHNEEQYLDTCLHAARTAATDAALSTVAVSDWTPHRHNAGILCEYFHNSYTDTDGHRHIHGPNMGVSAAAYLRASDFPPLSCSEVEALPRTGARFAWSAAPRVTTSARCDAKTRGGFGDTLLRYAESARAALANTALTPPPQNIVLLQSRT